MSKADEMFKKLGYEVKEPTNEIYKDDVLVNYEKNKEGTFDNSIVFWKKRTVGATFSLTMQELKVINKKVEELGWNE